MREPAPNGLFHQPANLRRLVFTRIECVSARSLPVGKNLVELYVRYDDEEWGVPQHDDRRMFEMLILESAQAG